MTTAERRAAILQQLAHAGAPIAARTLATHYGVSRQVIVQDLAVIRASHPGDHFHRTRLCAGAA